MSRSRSRESSYTRSQSEERRALMLPQELKAMGDDKQILLVEGMAHPVMSDKIRYFKEAAFKKRLLPKVDVPTLDMVRDPSVPAPGPLIAQTLAAQVAVARPPPEYTGLAGINSEIDAVLAHLSRMG
ncbi:MAG: type IV secretory system conjugative DNA transfer family protein [Burkholderiaceae bacterium]